MLSQWVFKLSSNMGSGIKWGVYIYKIKGNIKSVTITNDLCLNKAEEEHIFCDIDVFAIKLLEGLGAL